MNRTALTTERPWSIRKDWTYGPTPYPRMTAARQQKLFGIVNRKRRWGPTTQSNVERHARDTQLDNLAFGTTWTGAEIKFLSMPVQGITEAMRTGRYITISAVQFKFSVNVPAIEDQAAPLPDIPWKVCLVWDKQTNGAQFNAEDVFQTQTPQPPTQAFRDLNFTKRFKVLRSWDGVLAVGRTNVKGATDGQYSTPEVTSQVYEVNYKFKKPGLRTEFIASASGAVADVMDNSFTIIGVAGETTLNIVGNGRIRFTSA